MQIALSTGWRPLAVPRPLVVAAVFVLAWAVATGVAWDLPLNNDLSWQIWVARQLRRGAVFGRDITEINPPLWFWEAVPLSWAAERIGVGAGHVLIAAVMARSVLAVALTRAVLAPDSRRDWASAGLLLVLLVLPIFPFGERDHLAALGAVPYAALIAARAGGRRVETWLALLIGLDAAWGFALKPYFAVVPLTLEAWLLWRQRGAWRPLRPETIALLAIALAYAAAVLVFAREYLADVVPLARASYGEFAPPFVTLFTLQPYLPTWLLGALALVIARPRGLATQAAAVNALAFAASYLIQAKGFPYHALPVTISLLWALWLAALEAGVLRRPLTMLGILLGLSTALLFGRFEAPRLGAIDRALDRLPRGTVVAVISAHSWHAFPMVEDRGFTWPLSGGIALMPLRTILEQGEGPHATAKGQAVRRWTLDHLAHDLARCPPQALIVDDPAASPVLVGLDADYLGFLREDPRLAAMLAHFHPVARDGRTQLLLRDPPIARAATCFAPPPA